MPALLPILLPILLPLLLLAFAWAAPCARAEPPDPWHAPEHAHRAIVRVEAAGSHGTDVAAVRIRHAGRARPDGHDYRLFDAGGDPVPYQLTHHDPARDTLISFRAPEPRGRYHIYFGHPEAPRDPHRAIVDPAPGAGPPRPGPAAGGWIPRAGLVLITRRRPPEAPNPENVEALAALLEPSSALDGAGYRANIADSYNPFGDSDHYISRYRGWIELPRAGRWGFATASNEASFSFLGGKPLVHWPGRHTQDRGRRGQQHAEHTLEAGLHHIEYAHEELVLDQLAFLGWKPPGQSHYTAIPDARFVQPHRARVQHYEMRGEAGRPRPDPAPRPELVDSVWPSERETGQYTRYRFTADFGRAAGEREAWRFTWDFGDGHTERGRRVEHVFLKNGHYAITLRAVDPADRVHRRTWPLVVFPIEHLDGPYRRGRYPDHAPIVRRYDPEALPPGVLVELVHFLGEIGDEATAAAAAVAARHPALDRNTRARMHLAAAGPAGRRTGAWRRRVPPEQLEAETRHLTAARESAEAPALALRAAARLIRHLGAHRGRLAEARAVYKRAESIVEAQGLDGGARQAAWRRATLALGDAHLLGGAFEEAGRHYRIAEALAHPRVPPEVRKARIGAYPETLRQHLSAGRIGAAEGVVSEWLDRFPADQLRGAPLFWHSKLLLERGRPALAIRPLRLAIERGHGAPFEAEARWRLAEAYGKTGDPEARRATLRALLETGLPGPYRQRALEALGDGERGS